MKSQNIMKVTIVFFLLAFAIIFITTNVFDDNTAPVITYGSEPLTYKEGEDKKDLLADVVAKDKVEGDVSDSIIIETIQLFPDEEFANVIYAAKDSKNNIIKKSRKVYYVKMNTNDKKSNDKASDEENTSADNDTEVEATSNENGNLQDSQTVDNIQDTNSQDTNSQDSQDTNSQDTDTQDSQDSNNTQEDTATTTDVLTTDLDTEEPLVSTGVPIIRLNAHEVKISAGDYFNPMNYIEAAVDDKDDIYRRIQIQGDFTTNSPGEYTLEYRASDRDGNMSNVETLVLIVE